MKFHNCLVALVMTAALAACGGGGGSGGTPAFGGGTGGGTVVPASYVMQLQLQTSAGADIAGNSFAASDAVKLLATLKTAAGAPAVNEVVTFAETGSGLLQLTPVVATALTNMNGQAVIEVKAKTLESLGATTVSATATLAGTAYAATTNVAVTRAVVEGVDPQMLARALNFASAVPADKSIVIAGAGGNGRSETAILQYKVVDGTGAPVPGVRVKFETIPANVVTINSPTATTDASGIVSASVSSKAAPTSVVVSANVIGTALVTQSDILTVTTGVAVQQRFTLAASKFVLNHGLNLDPSTITVAVGDTNGNPVADGFAVIAKASHGLIGTADRGGCTTLNGSCTLDYRLQNVDLDDGEPIRITVSGESSAGALSSTIVLNATRVEWTALYDRDSNTALERFNYNPRTNAEYAQFSPATGCKVVWSGFLGTRGGLAAPAGATLSALSFNSVVGVAVTSGSPVADTLGGRTPVALTFSLTKAAQAGEAPIEFTVSAGGFQQTFAAKLAYPACVVAG